MIIVAFLAANGACAQWNFRLDTTFRTDIVERSLTGLHTLEDGTLFISGAIMFPGDVSVHGSSALLLNGARAPDFPVFPNTTGGGKIVPWIDGRFYVRTGLVRRMLPNGWLDVSFQHMNSDPLFSYAHLGDYHVFPDGRLLISGMHMLRDSVRGFLGMHNLIWFTNTGYLDTTRVHRKSDDGIIYDLAQLPDGGFIFTSNFNEFDGLPVDWIFRTDSLGIPDTTFRTEVFWGQAYCYLPLDDGRIYVGGNFRTTQAPGDTLRLVRLLPDGSLDPTFSIPAFGAGSGWPMLIGAIIHGIHPWKNGTLLINGDFRSVNGAPRKGICLIDTTGQLLDAFDDHGVGPFYGPIGTSASIVDILITPDSTALYICGAYVGYNDGTINDTQQRFVSRLLVEELHVGVPEEVAAPQPGPSLRLHPNPAGGTVTLALDQFIPDGELLVRDALGRLVSARSYMGGNTIMNLSDLPAGTYLVQVRAGGVYGPTQRLLIQP